MRRKSKNYFIGWSTATIFAFICAALAALEPPRNDAAGVVVDLSVLARASLFPWVGDVGDDAEVIVVGLDNRTLKDPEYAKIPRIMMSDLWADALENAFAGEARGAVFDVVFANEFPSGNKTLGDELFKFDLPFLGAIRKHQGRIVLARTADYWPARRFWTLMQRGDAGISLAQFPADADGRVRRATAHELDLDGIERPTLLGGALRRIATEEKIPALVHLTPPFPMTSLPYISLVDAAKCNESKAASLFKGRIVVFGGAINLEDQTESADRFLREKTTKDAEDQRRTCAAAPPIKAGDAGVFIQAAAIDGVLRGWAPRSSIEAGSAAAILAAFVVALVAGPLAVFRGSIWASVIALLVTPTFCMLVAAFLLEFGIVVAAAAPLLAAPVTFAVLVGVKIWIIDATRNLLHAQFSHYLAPEVIDEMVDEGKLPQLLGDEKNITVMFADLSGFTDFCARTRPRRAVRVINQFLTRISDIVIYNHNGCVDKYNGDEVMALWNAPNSVEEDSHKALAAALDIVLAVDQESAKLGENFSIKIGIEKGEALVGNVGSETRLSYTAMGSDVNLAARLQSANSRFKAGILIGPNAARAIKEANGPRLLRLAKVTVKGQEDKPADIFTPVGAKDRSVRDRHEEALAAFESGEFTKARDIWRRLAAWRRYSESKGLRQVPAPWAWAMAKEAVRASKLDKWDGVINMDAK